MMKKLRTFCLMLMMALLLLSLVGCSDSKTLKEDQYQVYHQGSSFTIKVTDTDINAENIETVKVKIKYKYTVIDYGDSSKYDADFKSKTETETFEVSKFENISGNFIGGFETENPVSEFECKRVVAYYAENSDPNDVYVSIPAAIGLSIGCLILGLVIWFILSLKMMDVNAAFYVAVLPYVIGFIVLLVTGQCIPALIFFIGIGALLTLVQTIFKKFVE